MGLASSDYRCVATVKLPADQAELYDKLICEAASVFKDRNWHLLIPGQKADIYDTTGAPPGLVRLFLNVWQIPDFDTLPQVMAYAADNPSYVKAQQMTFNETQNLYVTLRWDNPIGITDIPIGFYMMETLQIVNDITARNDFASYMDNAVYEMYSKYGWRIVFAGNATTGLINEYVNIWGMADTTKLEEAIGVYRAGAKWAAAVSRVTTSLWTARPMPCFDLRGMVTLIPAPAG
jgi:hypothetical protein